MIDKLIVVLRGKRLIRRRQGLRHWANLFQGEHESLKSMGFMLACEIHPNRIETKNPRLLNQWRQGFAVIAWQQLAAGTAHLYKFDRHVISPSGKPAVWHLRLAVACCLQPATSPRESFGFQREGGKPTGLPPCRHLSQRGRQSLRSFSGST